MNWRDFLSLATRLTAGATEADWRTAVSMSSTRRAYAPTLAFISRRRTMFRASFAVRLMIS